MNTVVNIGTSRETAFRPSHLLSTIYYPLSTICPSGGQSRRKGFTLVEMLVVIVIIVILMGVVFRMTKGVMGTSDAAREKVRVQAFKSLIQEFYDEYGCYPPVPEYDGYQPIEYKGPCPDSPADLNYYIAKKCADVFRFGLASFFVNRAQYAMETFNMVGETGNAAVRDKWTLFNDLDGGLPVVTSREKSFLKRTKPIRNMLGLVLGNDDENESMQPAYDINDPEHTTGFYVCPKDVWWQDYVYISDPPYTSYLFFSKGPDGKCEEPYDDPTKPLNRDNIYGTLSDK